MAGLLDSLFGTPEQTQALGLLGANLMAGNGAQGFLAANQHLAEAPLRKMKQQLMEAQIAETMAQADERKRKIKDSEELQGLMGSIFGPQGISASQVSPGAFAPSADGMGPVMPQSMAGQAAPGSRLASLGIDQLAALKMRGLDLTKLHEYANTPQKYEGGSTYENRITGRREYIPKIGEGMAPDGSGGFTDAPGYAGGAARIEGAKTAAQEAARAQNELVTLDLPGGPRQMTRAQALQYIGGQTPAQPAPRAPALPQVGGGQALTPELRAAIARDAAANGITNPQTAFTGAGPGQAYGMSSSGAAPAVAPSGGPGVALKPKPTKGQESLDAEFAKEYAAFGPGGGYADVQKQLVQLEEAASKLKPGSGVTGPVVGLLPDKVRAITSPGAVDTMEQVLETAQRNLRVVLGPQFTAKEGEALLARVYNPLLPPETNKVRVERLIQQIRQAAEVKADAGRYFEEHGTLSGWGGKLPTFADFEPAGRATSGKVAESPSKTAASANAFSDPGKEQRYQAWKRSQGK